MNNTTKTIIRIKWIKRGFSLITYNDFTTQNEICFDFILSFASYLWFQLVFRNKIEVKELTPY